MNIQIKKLEKTATIPTRGSKCAAGYDLYASMDDIGQVTIHPYKTQNICTGIAMAIPEGYFGAIYARSGIAANRGLRPANCVGVLDSDYRGEIIVALHNDSNEPQVVHNGDRIAQLVITPYISPELVEVDNLTETERGNGGFGHTGV